MHTLGGPVDGAAGRARARPHRAAHVDGHVSFRAPTCRWTGLDGDEWVGEAHRRRSRPSARPACRWAIRTACSSTRPSTRRRARKYGPLVENHAQFPTRTNVQLIQPVDRATVRALIWERGAGWTLASGTSSCARRGGVRARRAHRSPRQGRDAGRHARGHRRRRLAARADRLRAGGRASARSRPICCTRSTRPRDGRNARKPAPAATPTAA